MIHALFDTNIYGIMLNDAMAPELVQRIWQDRNFMIHNFQLIRKELRRAPRILSLYAQLTTRRVIEESRPISELAQDYFQEYKSNQGVQGRKTMLNDFKIVACASLKGFDLIVSEDRRTLQHPIALKAYRIVNLKRNLRTPGFYSYADLKRRYF
jgi:hypothetical protein